MKNLTYITHTAQTEKAVQLEMPTVAGGTVKIWLPLSQCFFPEGDVNVACVPEWIVEQKETELGVKLVEVKIEAEEEAEPVIRKADLAKIGEAVTTAVNELRDQFDEDLDEVPCDEIEAALVRAGLPEKTAEALVAIFTGIDEMSPSVQRWMSRIGDLAV